METSVNVKGYDGDIAILETDKDLLVQFHKKAVLNHAKSREAQAPIYEDLDFCKIIRPGEPHSVWDQPVRQIDKMRFAEKWRAYQENRVQEVSGTPLDRLFPDNPAVVANFRSAHIHTIQQLAGLSDNAIGNIPFGHDMRKKAQDFMNSLKKSDEEIQAMTEKHEAEMAAMRQMIAELTAKVSEPVSEPANKPKRKYTRREQAA